VFAAARRPESGAGTEKVASFTAGEESACEPGFLAHARFSRHAICSEKKRRFGREGARDGETDPGSSFSISISGRSIF
jgi:hypothetical protein